MKPTLGRIVIYKLTEDEKNKINGNKSEVLPAMVVAVWGPECVNLKVITDGINDLWVTSSQQGDGPRQWSWPVIEK